MPPPQPGLHSHCWVPVLQTRWGLLQSALDVQRHAVVLVTQLATVSGLGVVAVHTASGRVMPPLVTHVTERALVPVPSRHAGLLAREVHSPQGPTTQVVTVLGQGNRLQGLTASGARKPVEVHREVEELWTDPSE